MTSSPVVAIAVALCACGSGVSSTSPSTEGSSESSAAGTLAPDFTGRDITGHTFRLSDHLGKNVVLLDFWSTYCEPCKAEFPHLQAMYEDQHAQGLLVVGVAMDGPETVADVPSFVKRFELHFPVVTDEDSRIASLYDPKKSMPLSVLIDRGGRIVAVREGYAPGAEKLLAADVDRALGANAP
jgi:peroxiredoxin